MAWYDTLQKWIAEIGGTILLIVLLVRTIYDVSQGNLNFSFGLGFLYIVALLLIGWKGIAKILAGTIKRR